MKTSKSEAGNEALDFWQLFQSLPESYLLFEATPPYQITELNQARERLLGVPRAKAIGQPLFSIQPPHNHWYRGQPRNLAEAQIKKVLRTRQAHKLEVLGYDTKAEDGSVRTRYWQSTYIPHCFGGKGITHILAVTREVTDEQQATNRMRRTEERLQAALAIGKVGSWLWDLKTNIIVADATMARMFGVRQSAAAKGLPQPEFTGTIYQDDLKRVNAALQKAIRQRSLFEEEYRTIDSHGKLHWVIARGQVQGSDDHLVFPGVLMDITEQRDLQAKIKLAHKQEQLNRQESTSLQRRNEELEALARTKDEFVALASHQLRTPATAVKQYLGMVLQGYVGDISDLQADMLEKAFESNERQIQIINQILNAARVDTGRLVLTKIPLDLSNLTLGVAEEMRSSIEQRRHTFVVDLPQRPLPVIADLGYLRMAIENLLSNASIYTPEGGQVTLALKRAGRQAQLSVTDTGVGIKKADLGKLFTKFSRIHNPLSIQAGGSGIGLYLAAEIVRLHGGKVSVVSKVNHGTTFAILLPLRHNTIKKPFEGRKRTMEPSNSSGSPPG